MMTGIHSVLGFVFSRSHASNPSISGIWRSNKTRLGGSDSTLSSAILPFLAASTMNPQLERKWVIIARLSGSSSTTRIRSFPMCLTARERFAFNCSNLVKKGHITHRKGLTSGALWAPLGATRIRCAKPEISTWRSSFSFRPLSSSL